MMISQTSGTCSEIHGHFERQFAREYRDKRDAPAKANDGMPPALQPALHDERAYIDGQIKELLRLRAGIGADQAPSGIRRADIKTSPPGRDRALSVQFGAALRSVTTPIPPCADIAVPALARIVSPGSPRA